MLRGNQSGIALIAKEVRVQDVGFLQSGSTLDVARYALAHPMPIITWEKPTGPWLEDTRMMNRYAINFRKHFGVLPTTMSPDGMKQVQWRRGSPVHRLQHVTFGTQID
jgi:hypothetical protein